MPLPWYMRGGCTRFDPPAARLVQHRLPRALGPDPCPYPTLPYPIPYTLYPIPTL